MPLCEPAGLAITGHFKNLQEHEMWVIAGSQKMLGSKILGNFPF